MPTSPKESLVWLFPLTYALHLGEEYWGGEGFPSWISRVADASFTEQEFLALNGFALAMMTLGAWLIYQNTWRWLLIALGGVVFLNALFHLVLSSLTWTYSPGLISGTLFWLPLGAYTCWRQWQVASHHAILLGFFLALGLHTMVIMALLTS